MKSLYVTMLICLLSLLSVKVRAQCNPVSSFSEDFESATFTAYFPDCWGRNNTDMQVTTGAGQEGPSTSKALQLFNINQNYDLVSPEIVDISTNIFSFYFKSSAEATNVEIYLSVSPLPDQSDKFVVSNFTSGINIWEPVSINLSALGLIQSEYDYIHVKVQGSTSSTHFFDKFLMTNRPPTDISLSNASIQENLSSGIIVGTLSTTDPDTGDNHSYSLSGVDASSFQIDGDQLRSNEVFDFENKDSYEITVTSNDGNGNTFDKNFTISITNDVCDEAISTLDENFDAYQNTTTDLPECWQRSFPATVETQDKAINLVAGELAMIYNSSDVNANNRVSVVLPKVENLNSKQFSFTARNRQPSQVHSLPVYTAESAFSSNRFFAGNITISSISATTYTYDFNTLSMPASHQYIQIELATNTAEIRLDNFVISEPNSAPTDINLSSNSLDENNAVGNVVGSLSSVDANAADNHTYSFVAGAGDLDNGSFTISGNEIQAASVFNYESQSSYSVRIQTDDGNGGAFQKIFSVTINDINDEPNDISLSSIEISENNSIGDVVATISTEDEDDGDSHTYTLVAGTGDADNASFSISGSQLVAQEVFDTNSKTNYTIRLKSTDIAGAVIEKEFSLSVVADNEAPVGISLSPGSIDENNAVGDVIGTFTTNDPNPNDIHTYSLVTGNGDTDNASFTISGDQLLAAEVFDFEVKSTYAIRIQTDDGNGGTLEGPMSIIINDISENSAPTFIELTSLTTSEADPIGTEVAQFITTDPDPNDTHTYSLSGTDASAFSVNGDRLITAIEFDHETKSTYTIDVTTTDQAGESFTSSQTITILNANDAPTDITLSGNTVDENMDTGTAIGTFSTEDQDVNDRHSYSLVSGTGDDDNASFLIVGNELQTAEVFDFEAQSAYSIRVQTDDGNGGQFEESFTINILDVEEAVLSNRDEANDFKLYPNPANEVLHFSNLHNLRNVKIMTAEGVFVRNLNSAQLDKPFNTQNLNEGLYLIQIQMKNGKMLTKRLVISH